MSEYVSSHSRFFVSFAQICIKSVHFMLQFM
jgi:hypothetical protein